MIRGAIQLSCCYFQLDDHKVITSKWFFLAEELFCFVSRSKSKLETPFNPRNNFDWVHLCVHATPQYRDRNAEPDRIENVLIKRFSNESPKTRTKVIALGNHRGYR